MHYCRGHAGHIKKTKHASFWRLQQYFFRWISQIMAIYPQGKTYTRLISPILLCGCSQQLQLEICKAGRLHYWDYFSSDLLSLRADRDTNQLQSAAVWPQFWSVLLNSLCLDRDTKNPSEGETILPEKQTIFFAIFSWKTNQLENLDHSMQYFSIPVIFCCFCSRRQPTSIRSQLFFI